MRIAYVALLQLIACRSDVAPSSTAAPSQSPPASSAVEERPAPPRREGCVPLVESDVAAQAYADGVARLEESRDGEHYRAEPFEAGIDALKIAAQNGHLEAQSLYGRTLFGARFTTQAPTPEEKEDYVSAVAFLRIAAMAGDADAAAFMPGLTSDPAPLEAPLDSLPEGWVVEAFSRADTWIECNGLPEAP